jgi:hypothetical protein
VAKQLCNSFHDNCTTSENLRFTFGTVQPEYDIHYKNDIKSSVRKVEELPVKYCGTAPFYVDGTVSVWDEEGNRSTCKVVIKMINPNLHVYTMLSAEGIIKDINEQPMQGVNIEILYTGIQDAVLTKTNATGSYFLDCGYSRDYFIAKPILNSNPLDGVSSADLVAIRKHLSGAKPFDHPFQYIAADTNQDKLIDDNDIKEIQNLILGKTVNFPNSNSWRFTSVATDLESDKFNLIESVKVDACDSLLTADFYAIKIGDVNLSR